MVVSMIEPLIENATRTDWFVRSMSVIIPMVPLHIPCSIDELLRYITRAPGCNLTEEGKLVLVLKICSEEEGSHCAESIISVDWEIKNFSLDTGSILQIILLTCWAVSLKPTILVVLRRVSVAGRVRNSE